MRLGHGRRLALFARIVSGFVVASSFVLLAAQPASASTVWTYGNYLYSLDIGSFNSPVVAGNGATVQATVGANTAVDVHIEFKGQFSWGAWTYSSDVIPITGAGTFTVTGSPVVPYKALIDPAQFFFDYVFVTLPGDSWSPAAWGLTRTVPVIAPAEVSHAELAGLMSQLKFEVDTSSIAPELKDSLMSKLNRAGQAVDQAYAEGKLKRLQRAIEALGSFIRELGVDQEGSDAAEARPPDAALWAQQATFIRSEVARALPAPSPESDSGSSD